MRARHRTPATFGLWMVDVLCCALGCIILLWLTKRDEAAALESRADDLAAAKALLESEKSEFEKSSTSLTEEQKKKIRDLLDRIAVLSSRGDALEKKLKELSALKDSLEEDLSGEKKAAKVKIDGLAEKLAELSKAKAGVDAVLAKRLEEMAALQKQLGSLKLTEEELLAAKKQGELKQKRIDELLKEADELTKKATTAQALVNRLQKDLAVMPKIEDDLKAFKAKLTEEEKKNVELKGDLGKRLEELAKAAKEYETLMLAKRELDKKLDGVDKALITALADKARLAEAEKKIKVYEEDISTRGKRLTDALELLAKYKGDVSRLEEQLDRRFAGVALTGEKVIFLVDTSGSMELEDPNKPSLEKWKEVRETLVKVMKSMPKLKQFQLITFGEEIAHPLGKPGEWLDFDAQKTPKEAAEALAKIKPSGGTNMYRPFDAAFKMRKDGLDTIYVFSDGLPSDGEGLTADQERTIKDESIRTAILSKFLRKKLKEEWNKEVGGQPRVRINSIGFFYESPDVGAFLWALSREHDGSFVGMSKP